MQIFNCIIVEDEPLAAEVIQDYIEQIPFLCLKGVCGDAIYAIELLRKEPIDLIFLDIHLPKLKGIDFIKTLKNPPHIILTTAYNDYALQSYEYNVLDYLLKPIEFSRFLMAVNKLKQPSEQKLPEIMVAVAADEKKFIFVNVNKKRVKIYLNEIVIIESLREYVRIITTTNQNIVTKFQLGQIEELLVKNNFLRVHRSYIVAKDKISAFTATEIEIIDRKIPIGRSYKDIVISVLENKS